MCLSISISVFLGKKVSVCFLSADCKSGVKILYKKINLLLQLNSFLSIGYLFHLKFDDKGIRVFPRDSLLDL